MIPSLPNKISNNPKSNTKTNHKKSQTLKLNPAKYINCNHTFGLPPNVHRLPIIGSLLSMIYHGKDFYTKYLPRYGPIVSYCIGNSNKTIILNDPKIIRKVLSNKYCTQRPQTFRKLVTLAKAHPISFVVAENNDKHCSLQRRNIIKKHISQFANSDQFSKVFDIALKDVFFQEIDKCIEKGKLFTNVRKTTYKFAFMVVMLSMFGKQENNSSSSGIDSGIDSGSSHSVNDYDKDENLESSELSELRDHVAVDADKKDIDVAVDGYDKREYEELLKNINECVSLYCVVAISLMFDFVNKFSPIQSKLHEFCCVHNKCVAKIEDLINRRIRLLKLGRDKEVNVNVSGRIENNIINNDSKTVFDTLYQELILNGETRKNFTMTKEILTMDVWGIVGAGSDTTGVSQEGILLFFAKYFELQNEIYETELKHHIINICGNNKKKKYQFDKTKIVECVKLRAFIHESLRIANPAIRGFPRALTQTCILSFNKGKFEIYNYNYTQS